MFVISAPLLSSIRKVVSPITLLLLLWAVLVTRVDAQVQDRQWSEPYLLSSLSTDASEGTIVSDGNGGVIVTWIEAARSDGHKTLKHAHFDGDSWSTPATIVEGIAPFTTTMRGRIGAALSPTGQLHVIWSEQNSGPLFHTSAHSCCGPDGGVWQVPRLIETNAYEVKLRSDSQGTLHLVYTRWFSDQPGVFHQHSADLGITWSEPARLDPKIPEEATPMFLQTSMGQSDDLHLVWQYVKDELAYTVSYAHSLDGGATWSSPILLDEADEGPRELWFAYPELAVQGESVHVLWAAGGTAGVGRRHRFSTDRGLTWSEYKQIFGNLHGQAMGQGAAFDSQGTLNYISQIRYPQGIYHARWEGAAWAKPSLTYLIADNWLDPLDGRIHAHLVNLKINASDQFVTVFTTSPTDPQMILYSMHTRPSTLIFPHYGDGQGLSTRFVLTNTSDQPVSGVLRFFDSVGKPQGQDLSGLSNNSASEIPIELVPKSTNTVTTSGSSTTLKSGYVEAAFDLPGVTGVGIFQFESGLEASVLPSQPGRRFALFVERSSELDTGIALLRVSPRAIRLNLYDLEGTLIAEKDWNFPQVQQARFLSELFSVPMGFQGLLILDSEGDFAPIGLRFGGETLSTIPTTDINWLDSESLYFPHYGDGTGLSMKLFVGNLSEDQSIGKVSFFDSNGNSQPLPLAEGLLSEVPLELRAKGSLAMNTDGSSNPLKSGYLRVDLDQKAGSGAVIFKFDTGPEATVLPVRPSRRFALFAEKSPEVDTGLAILRLTSKPLKLTLFDEDGRLVETVDYDFEGQHQARFLSEIFAISQDFRGLLILESEADFAPLGLRFGSKVLSTIPVAPIE